MPFPHPAVRRWPPRPRVSAVFTAGALALALAFGAGGTAPAAQASTSPWYEVETWYLKLVNCTRTGGWIMKTGTCVGYGTGTYSKYVAPLKLHAGISNVARSWAKRIAVNNKCAHGDPGARLRAAGYTGWSWGENIGCGWGTSNIKASVLASHRAMQAERSTNGGHWKNIKNPRFKVVGIGIWKDGSQIRVVNDFYQP